jgi:hypothetical protein
MVAIPAPLAIPTMFMIANDDVFTIASNNLPRRGVSDGERRHHCGT